MENIISHGTWYDKIAFDLIEREQELGRKMDLLRIESGVAASGIPHIGSFSEVTRNYAVALALKEQGYNSEFIVFSDNRDGLRNIPRGLPNSLRKYLGFPVTRIPDPFSCHSSYGEHMVNLLLEALDISKVKYNLIKGTYAYETGLLAEEIQLLLENAKYIGQIVLEETGQKKYEDALPFFPLCASCKKIYTTKAYQLLPEEKKIVYKCEGMEIKNKWLAGCGYEGEMDYTKGLGKLSWKAGELAARWRALGIRFEAYGKDIADSVRVNDRISREILCYEPPLHVQYEMFLDKGGKKISKSVGNVFTPQVWLRYGSPQSMVLLTLKRFTGSRNVSIIDIPRYMDELDDLEDTYFGRKHMTDRKKKAKLTGLFNYVWFMNPPGEPRLHVPYNLLAGLARVAPKASEAIFIVEKLRSYGYINKEIPPDLEKRIEYALNWVKDFKETTETKIELRTEERTAVKQLIKKIQKINDEELIQSAIFETSRNNGLKPKIFFRILYKILLGTSSGPRLGTYIIDMGRENAIRLLRNGIKRNY